MTLGVGAWHFASLREKCQAPGGGWVGFAILRRTCSGLGHWTRGATQRSKCSVGAGQGREESEKTAFNTQFGAFECVVKPFGLYKAPPTFQRVVNDPLFAGRSAARPPPCGCRPVARAGVARGRPTARLPVRIIPTVPRSPGRRGDRMAECDLRCQSPGSVSAGLPQASEPVQGTRVPGS